MAQQKTFTVEVLGNALEVTPESGTPRRIGATEIESVWEKYRQTKSLKPGDYQQDSQNASYLLALIDLLLRD